MTALYATDLDRTLIYSTRAAATTGPLLPVERYGGEDISFMSPRQVALLAAIGERAVVVPVTTRTVAQYQRVTIWGEPPRWAVVANGGILLDGGVPDEGWSASVRAGLVERCDELPAVASWLATAAGPWIDHVRIADDLFAYSLVDRAAFPAAAGIDLAERLADRGWTLSIQGRKLYAVPTPLTKTAAVREVARRAGTGVLLAAGDSLLDRDLLDAADVSLRPAHGELHEIAAPADVVTRSSGVAAGEELLQAVLDRLTAADDAQRARGAHGDDAGSQAGGRVPPVQRAPAARAWPA